MMIATATTMSSPATTVLAVIDSSRITAPRITAPTGVT
jgi:hypothetical protein